MYGSTLYLASFYPCILVFLHHCIFLSLYLCIFVSLYICFFVAKTNTIDHSLAEIRLNNTKPKPPTRCRPRKQISWTPSLSKPTRRPPVRSRFQLKQGPSVERYWLPLMDQQLLSGLISSPFTQKLPWRLSDLRLNLWGRGRMMKRDWKSSTLR